MVLNRILLKRMNILLNLPSGQLVDWKLLVLC